MGRFFVATVYFYVATELAKVRRNYVAIELARVGRISVATKLTTTKSSATHNRVGAHDNVGLYCVAIEETMCAQQTWIVTKKKKKKKTRGLGCKS